MDAIISSANAVAECLSSDAAKARLDNNIKAWRYRYAGDWPNQKLSPSSGSYHSSELAMLFGTTEYLSRYYGELFKQNFSFPDTEEQKKLAKTMMTAWTSFAKDPENGLSKFGWPVYDPKSRSTH
jgi:cholinesterase